MIDLSRKQPKREYEPNEVEIAALAITILVSLVVIITTLS